MTLIWSPRII